MVSALTRHRDAARPAAPLTPLRGGRCDVVGGVDFWRGEATYTAYRVGTYELKIFLPAEGEGRSDQPAYVQTIVRPPPPFSPRARWPRWCATELTHDGLPRARS